MVSGPPAADACGVMIPQFAHEPETSPVTVFVAARHERVRAALWQLLEDEPGIEPLAATADLADTIRLLERLRPAVVVVEQAVLGGAGLDALAALAEVAPQAGIVVVGMHDHPGYVTWARDAGAADYVRLDEAAERLAPAVWEASERTAAVLVPGPACGEPGGQRRAEIGCRVDREAATEKLDALAHPVSPNPAGGGGRVKALTVVANADAHVSVASAMSTATDSAPECLTALVIASCVIR